MPIVDIQPSTQIRKPAKKRRSGYGGFRPDSLSPDQLLQREQNRSALHSHWCACCKRERACATIACQFTPLVADLAAAVIENYVCCFCRDWRDI